MTCMESKITIGGIVSKSTTAKPVYGFTIYSNDIVLLQSLKEVIVIKIKKSCSKEDIEIERKYHDRKE